MIKYENVSFSYSERKEGAVKDINLFIDAGECVVFCGRSGCGKTTLLRMINGLIPNFFNGEITGKVTVDDMDMNETELFKVSEKVGSVFQNPRSQFFNGDVHSEIAFGMENLAWDNEKMQRRFDETVHNLEIEDLCEKDIFNLSGGEKQKVAFASIDTVSPDIYVLDEPSSNLDEDTMLLLSGYLKELKSKGKTIIISEHRLNYLKDIADRYIYMDRGSILAQYTAQELLRMTENTRRSKGLRSMNLTGKKTGRNCMEKESAGTGKKDLSIRGLTLYRDDRILFKNLNFTACAGNMIAVVGKNGIGKTTFTKMLCGLYKQYEGDIQLNGRRVTDAERLKKSYMVMQDVNYQLFAEEVFKECTFGMKNRKDGECEKVLKKLSLWDKRMLHPNTLSGGEKQRLAVAVSLLSDKDIIVFDEPTSGLDYDSMVRVCGIMKELSEMGKIIFVVTHDYELIEQGKFKVWHLGGLPWLPDMP